MCFVLGSGRYGRQCDMYYVLVRTVLILVRCTGLMLISLSPNGKSYGKLITKIVNIYWVIKRR